MSTNKSETAPFRAVRQVPRTLARWLHLNGASVRSHAGRAWVAAHVTHSTEFTLALWCADRKIPFLLPTVVLRESKRLVPLWNHYLFCALTPAEATAIRTRTGVWSLLREPAQDPFIALLQRIAPFNSVHRRLPIGARVRAFSGLSDEIPAVVRSTSTDGRQVTLEHQLFGQLVRFPWPVDQVHSEHPLAVSIVREDVSDIIETLGAFRPKPTPIEQVNVELSAINEELVRYLAKHPELLRQLPARRFEELVAELMRDMGYDVYLTPQTRDKGRDILAVFRVPHGEILTLVECKRHAAARPVGIGIVERFMWTIQQNDRANCGIIATSSHFSPDARDLARRYQWLLRLHDFDGIREWMGQYGRMLPVRGAGMWLPSAPVGPTALEERLAGLIVAPGEMADTALEARAMPRRTLRGDGSEAPR